MFVVFRGHADEDQHRLISQDAFVNYNLSLLFDVVTIESTLCFTLPCCTPGTYSLK